MAINLTMYRNPHIFCCFYHSTGIHNTRGLVYGHKPYHNNRLAQKTYQLHRTLFRQPWSSIDIWEENKLSVNFWCGNYRWCHVPQTQNSFCLTLLLMVIRLSVYVDSSARVFSIQLLPWFFLVQGPCLFVPYLGIYMLLERARKISTNTKYTTKSCGSVSSDE